MSLRGKVTTMTGSISHTAIIHPNVKLGENVVIEDYCIIGLPPMKATGSEVTIIGDNAWIRSHSVIYAGNKIGRRFATGHQVSIREFNEIGDDVSIGTKTVIEHHVKINDRVRIHSAAFVPEYTVIHEDAWLGPNVVLTNAKYPKSPEAKNNLKGVIVGRHAKIGANATVLPGIRLGEGSLVGAGSVVTKDVGENTVVVGNPAKQTNQLSNLPYS